ncbi:MAG TPA: HAMP domain-containing sensor histidine kinase [Gammaproteobacteria bacterium]|nr:HAMP domain-containing sensor histidine kinase [Gammaproteobacteria bacterium]
MKLLPASSILRLTLAAFVVVTLPLAIGLITATISVQHLGAQGQQAVRTAADTVRYSRLMVEQLTGMERSARQYRVLRDPTLYQLYLKQRRAFRDTSADFKRLDLNPEIRKQLNELTRREAGVFDQFDPKNPDSDAARAALAQFGDLHRLARAILSAGTEAIGTEVDRMQAAAGALQSRLWWLAITLIPLVLIVAALAVALISRPIQRLGKAINRLGDGGFDQSIAIEGPKDLVELGRRLDWLRIRLNDLEQHRVRFLQHISHELKTPLTAVREGTQLLTDEVTGPLNAEQREVAEILHASGLQLQKRIEDLLNFSSLEDAGGGAWQAVSLDRVVARVVGEQRVPIRAKKLMVTPDLEPATVFGDPERIRLVVENLFTNAVKYSPVGGSIRFHLRRREGQIILDVQDEGPGVEPAEREKVFEAFYQGQPPPNVGPIKGTGLGLAIAREYLRACQGTIEIIDAAVGAHFRVTLPADNG